MNNVSTRVSDHMFGSGYMSQYGLKPVQLKRTTRARKSVKPRKRKSTKSKTTKPKRVKKKAVKKKRRTKTTTRKRKTKTKAKRKTSRLSKHDIVQDIFS